MAIAFERKTNQFLACARQTLNAARSNSESAQALISAALLAFERSVVFYLLERIVPHAGKHFEPLRYSNLPDLLAYYQKHQNHISCSEIAALYLTPSSWLAQLAALYAQDFNTTDTALKSAFFVSDKSGELNSLPLISSSNESQTIQVTSPQLETWLNEFMTMVRRQRLENDEY